MSKTNQEIMEQLRKSLIDSLFYAELLHNEFLDETPEKDTIGKIVEHLRLSLYQELYLTREHLNIPHTRLKS